METKTPTSPAPQVGQREYRPIPLDTTEYELCEFLKAKAASYSGIPGLNFSVWPRTYAPDHPLAVSAWSDSTSECCDSFDAAVEALKGSKAKRIAAMKAEIAKSEAECEKLTADTLRSPAP